MVLYFELFFIYFFFVCGICCSFFVVFSINPIHSILFLILVFFNISGILILLGLEYFALIFIIIYVGAISVLFLFIIMMLNIRIIELKDNLWRYAFFGFLFTGLFVSEIFFLIVYDSNFFFVNYLDSNNYINWIDFFYFKFTLNFLGETLYIYYFLIFLLSSFLLFLAMFGAILLTLNQSQLIKRQKIYKQILKNSKNSLIFKRIKYSL